MLQVVKGAPQFSVDRQPSAYFSLYLGLLHAGLIASLGFYPVDYLYLSPVVILLLWHWRYSFLRYNSACSHRWVSQLQARSDGLYLRQNAQDIPVLIERASLWSCLIVINLRHCEMKRRYSVVFFPDSAGAGQQRQLRVLLRHCLAARI